MPRIETNVYVDGLNLYNGCLKETPYRWLHISKLCTLLLSQHRINRIRYFTAIVSSSPEDPNQTQRQLTYIRALETIPNLKVHYGQFKERQKRRPLVKPPEKGSRWALVKDREEKMSDVNLATYLLLDAFRKEYEMAVLVTNDADLLEPLKVVTEELGLRIGILNPYNICIKDLDDVAEFYRPISEKTLAASQFPPTLNDAHGTITKPSEW